MQDAAQPWTASLDRLVRAFLSDLSTDDQIRIKQAVDKLIELNTSAKYPLVKHLEGKRWELRVNSCTREYRLVYFFDSGRCIRFVHGFIKDTNKTSRRDKQKARKRFKKYRKRL